MPLCHCSGEDLPEGQKYWYHARCFNLALVVTAALTSDVHKLCASAVTLISKNFRRKDRS